MDLLKSLNANIKAEQAELDEIYEFIAEMEVLDSKNVFNLMEIFGGARREKKRIAEIKAKLVKDGRSARGNANKAAPISGGIDNSGRLAELIKLYGPPVFNGEQPPEKPNGMSPEDYKIWLEGAGERAAPNDTGPAVGPEIGNIIRKNGVFYEVISSTGLSSIARDKEGRKIKVNWATLGKPVAKGGITLYDVS